MKVLVLNGSPKKVSDTMQLTGSFLEGLVLCQDLVQIKMRGSAS